MRLTGANDSLGEKSTEYVAIACSTSSRSMKALDLVEFFFNSKESDLVQNIPCLWLFDRTCARRSLIQCQVVLDYETHAIFRWWHLS